jgi:hypothetical protein
LSFLAGEAASPLDAAPRSSAEQRQTHKKQMQNIKNNHTKRHNTHTTPRTETPPPQPPPSQQNNAHRHPCSQATQACATNRRQSRMRACLNRIFLRKVINGQPRVVADRDGVRAGSGSLENSVNVDSRSLHLLPVEHALVKQAAWRGTLQACMAQLQRTAKHTTAGRM